MILRQERVRVKSVWPGHTAAWGAADAEIKDYLPWWEPSLSRLSEPVADNVKKKIVLWPVVGQNIALHAVPAYKASIGFRSSQFCLPGGSFNFIFSTFLPTSTVDRMSIQWMRLTSQ